MRRHGHPGALAAATRAICPRAGALLAALTTACATGAPPTPTELPEVFQYAYNFEGSVGMQTVTGYVQFEPDPTGGVAYRLYYNLGDCRGRIPRPADRRVTLRCGGLELEFLRGGQLAERSHATLMSSRGGRPQQESGVLQLTRR